MTTRQHGGDESTFEHAHVQLAKHDLRFLEQETQQKLQEIQTTNGQLPTRTCKAEEDGGHEKKPFTNLRIIATGYSLFPHVFVILLTIANDDVPTSCFLFSPNCEQYTHKYSTYSVAQYDHTSSREHA